MTGHRPQVNPERLQGNLKALAAIGRNAAGGIDRQLGSPADSEARAFLRRLWEDMGLLVRTDAIANLWGESPDAPEGKPIVLGSHHDTVPNGGAYDGALGVLSFEFYNGAMSTAQCRRLLAAIAFARGRPTRVLVLDGGAGFWSNGIHLNTIEAAPSPADESWANIEAIDDVCLALLGLTDRLTVAALRGNAGAGGCFLALACDRVWAREGVVMNPHYKNMGNLFGSEYWTYLLPRRVGEDAARAIMRNRLPLLAREAAAQGLIDDCFGADRAGFTAEVEARARTLADDPGLAARIADKARRRAADEAAKPLAAYRAAELDMMRRNFYGFDPSYHVARYHFVLKSPQSWTPRHLARHRELGWRAPAASAA